MEELLERLLEECRPTAGQGHVADYIPELAKGDPDALGIYIIGSEGKRSWAGDCRRTFTIQSIVKPILLLQALLDNGTEFVMERVGVEATGKPFDAINAGDQTLDSGNINPMVNMGAIVMCSLIRGGSYDERFGRLLELTRRMAGDGEIGVDEAVYRSEKSHGSKNRALAYLLKANGLLDGDVEEVLDCYFRACSIRVDCRALAHIGAVLSNRGRLPVSNEHHGGGPHPHGERHLWPRPGPQGQQRSGDQAAGAPQRGAAFEHFLSGTDLLLQNRVCPCQPTLGLIVCIALDKRKLG